MSKNQPKSWNFLEIRLKAEIGVKFAKYLKMRKIKINQGFISLGHSYNCMYLIICSQWISFKNSWYKFIIQFRRNLTHKICYIHVVHKHKFLRPNKTHISSIYWISMFFMSILLYLLNLYLITYIARALLIATWCTTKKNELEFVGQTVNLRNNIKLFLKTWMPDLYNNTAIKRIRAKVFHF